MQINPEMNAQRLYFPDKATANQHRVDAEKKSLSFVRPLTTGASPVEPLFTDAQLSNMTRYLDARNDQSQKIKESQADVNLLTYLLLLRSRQPTDEVQSTAATPAGLMASGFPEPLRALSRSVVNEISSREYRGDMPPAITNNIPGTESHPMRQPDSFFPGRQATNEVMSSNLMADSTSRDGGDVLIDVIGDSGSNPGFASVTRLPIGTHQFFHIQSENQQINALLMPRRFATEPVMSSLLSNPPTLGGPTESGAPSPQDPAGASLHAQFSGVLHPFNF